jgi:2-polyprenyl-3-methyl-5-hydroxy-6-metoxy-1,4-benzoquinol methylase
MEHKVDIYDDFASEYADMVAAREEKGIEQEPIIPLFLKILGDVSSLTTLDAGCGEGYLSRILAHRGANVTGIDISARLVDVPTPEGAFKRRNDTLLPAGYHFPFFMILSFVKL